MLLTTTTTTATTDSALPVTFRTRARRPSRNFASSDGPSGSHLRSSGNCGQGFLSRATSDLSWYRPRGSMGGSPAAARRNFSATRVFAVPEHSGSLKPYYHPLEEIEEEVLPLGDGGDARLTDAETARTITEVNSKATIIFSGMVEEVHENIFCPDLAYLTDEHGDIYFEVNNDQDILQALTADDKLVQVIIGMDNIDVVNEMEMIDSADFDFGIEEMASEDSDIDDDYEGDLVAILEDDKDDAISSETGNWTNLETMRSSHPMYFANKISEVISDSHMDWLEEPSASIVIQGLLRPVFIEESTPVPKYPAGIKTNNNNIYQLGKVVEDNLEEELEKDQSLQSGTAFYKLDMINILLVSAYGSQTIVKVQDFRKAMPDFLAHSAGNIISRLKAGGEKTIQALKSLCWRHKCIQVEEAALTGVDSLGFDLRVCSGTQIQTLRFAFSRRATSEYSAERQIHDLLFPRFQHKQQMWPQAKQKEC